MVEFRSISFIPSLDYQGFYRFFYYRWCLDVILYFYLVSYYYRLLHFFIFLTVQQRIVDRLTFNFYVEETRDGSTLVIEASGVDPLDYLREFAYSFSFYVVLYFFIIGPETEFTLFLFK